MIKRILVGLASVFCIILLLGGYYYKIRTETQNVNVVSGEIKELTTNEKLQDFDYMYNILKENFPYFDVKKRSLGYDWLSNREQFEEWIKNTKSNEEFYSTLDKIVKLVQNGHTDVIPPDFFESYRQTYVNCGYKSWMDIVNNRDVKTKYDYWGSHISRDSDEVIPIEFNYIEGQYVAVNSSLMNCSLNKFDIPEFSILEEINGRIPEEYLRFVMDKRLLKYDFKRKKIKLDTLYIYKERDKINLILKTPDGNKIERNISVFQKLPSNTKDNTDNYKTEILKDKKVAYLKVPSFEYPSVSKDADGIYQFLKYIKDYPYLIIDIRGNGGGSDSYWRNNIVGPLISKVISVKSYLACRDGEYIIPFLRTHGMPIIKDITVKSTLDAPDDFKCPPELKKEIWWYQGLSNQIRPRNPVGFKGKIYLLTDDYVFSSAESFAVFAKASKWATLVGTTTGGDGIGIDPCIMALPNSGLIVRFPLDMGINPDGTANEETHTLPDIYVEQSITDYPQYVRWNESHKDNIINPYDTVINSVINSIR